MVGVGIFIYYFFFPLVESRFLISCEQEVVDCNKLVVVSELLDMTLAEQRSLS